MNTNRRTRNHRRAFTIVEVMIVLVIIGLIGAIVGINLVGAAEEARIRTTKESLRNVQAALKMYYGSNGAYPIGKGSLEPLIQANVLQLDGVPTDAWSTPIEFYSDGVDYTVRSLGKDKTPDTVDDIEFHPDHQ